MQLDFFYHNRTPSYASMSTISGHGPLWQKASTWRSMRVMESKEGMATGLIWQRALWQRALWQRALWQRALYGNGPYGNGPYGNGPYMATGLMATGLMATGLIWQRALWQRALWQRALYGNGPYGDDRVGTQGGYGNGPSLWKGPYMTTGLMAKDLILYGNGRYGK